MALVVVVVVVAVVSVIVSSFDIVAVALTVGLSEVICTKSVR